MRAAEFLCGAVPRWRPEGKVSGDSTCAGRRAPLPPRPAIAEGHRPFGTDRRHAAVGRRECHRDRCSASALGSERDRVEGTARGSPLSACRRRHSLENALHAAGGPRSGTEPNFLLKSGRPQAASAHGLLSLPQTQPRGGDLKGAGERGDCGPGGFVWMPLRILEKLTTECSPVRQRSFPNS